MDKQARTYSIAWGIILNILKPWNGTHVTKAGIGSILCYFICSLVGSLVAQMVKTLAAMQEAQVWSLGQEDPPEKGMATQSSILAWKIPWAEEAGRLQSMGSLRVRHNWVISTICSLTVGNSNGKNLPTVWETWVWSLDREDPLEEGMETHSRTFAWKIPWTEVPGGLQPMGSQRVGHDSVPYFQVLFSSVA